MAQPLDPEDIAIHDAILDSNSMDARSVFMFRVGTATLSAILLAAMMILTVGRREYSPRTEMVLPATTFLDKGVHELKDLKTISTELKTPVLVPDLRQLGIKLSRMTSTDFGGVHAALMECSYGKSVVLIYRFVNPSGLMPQMKMSKGKTNTFYYDSDQSVSVVAWKDKKLGFYAIAAKSTEKDLLGLADKIVPYL